MTPTNPTDAQMKLADVTDADVTAALPTESELKLARKCTARANFLLEKKTLQSILNGEQDTWPEVVASILAIRATEARAQGLVDALEDSKRAVQAFLDMVNVMQRVQALPIPVFLETAQHNCPIILQNLDQALATWRRT